MKRFGLSNISISLVCGPSLAVTVAAAVVVGFALPTRQASAADYTAWHDVGIVYSAPSGSAYYPSVIFEASGFGSGAPLFKMWYSDGNGNAFLTTSSNGDTWGPPTGLTGLDGHAHHVQVLYDAGCFGASPCGPSTVKYKIWHWDISADVYSISAIAYAESADGVSWANHQAVTQDSSNPLVTGAGTGWNRGTYGPVYLFYQAGAGNSGTDPWGYRYVMYYDATDGSFEFTGLAYSTDGLHWVAYSGNPVLQGEATAAWDCSDNAYGTVLRDAAGFHYWYSGAGGCQDHPLVEGIGYASSSDGEHWAKSVTNPIFHISQGVSYRNARVYTPAVVRDGMGVLRMYYSALAQGDDVKRIGLATDTSFEAPIQTAAPAMGSGNLCLLAALLAVLAQRRLRTRGRSAP